MAFDIQPTQRSLPGRSTSVIKDLDVRTGREQVAQAVGQAGEALTGNALISHNLEAKVQISEFDRQALEAKNNLELALAGEATTDNYDTLYESSVSGLDALTPKNKKAAAHAQDVIATLRLNGNRTMELEKIKRNKQTALLDMFNKVERGDFAGARTDIKEGVAAGLLTAVQARSLLSDMKVQETEAKERLRSLGVLENARSIAESDSVGAAVKFINSQTGKISSDLTRDKAFRTDAITQLKSERGEAEVQLQDDRDQERTDLANAILTNRFNDAQSILGNINSSLSGSERISLGTQLNSIISNAGKVRDKNALTASYIPGLEAQFRRNAMSLQSDIQFKKFMIGAKAAEAEGKISKSEFDGLNTLAPSQLDQNVRQHLNDISSNLEISLKSPIADFNTWFKVNKANFKDASEAIASFIKRRDFRNWAAGQASRAITDLQLKRDMDRKAREAAALSIDREWRRKSITTLEAEFNEYLRGQSNSF